ncbi:hypothetical protein [Flavobacterium pectinovorum]|uniref:hypothetical protein n=1 Tax=Flavobacterium pectinovorum TaxID=29533 RepID=UPI001FAE7155|nr:hypothetical protein [Flavobacterium pectinovorum]MCI9843314.1 hypothetical protein [Flavobacterium pectinovorum]
MKKILLTTFFFSFAINCWGQEKERHTSVEKDYHDKDLKNEKNTSIRGRVNRSVKPEETNTYVIEYDFKNGVYNRNLLNLKVNTPVVFKIVNINRLAYDVKVTPRDSVLADTGWEDGVLEFLKENALPTANAAKEKEEAKVTASTEIKKLDDNDVKNILPDNTNKTTMIKNMNDISYNMNLGINQLEQKIADNKIAKLELEQKKTETTTKINTIDLEINKNDSGLSSEKVDILKKEKENLQKSLAIIEQKIGDNNSINNQDSQKLEETRKKLKIIDANYQQLELDYTALTTSFYKLKEIYFKILKVNDCYNEVRLDMSNPLLAKTITAEKAAKLKSMFPELRTEYKDFLGTYIQLGHEFYILNHNEKIFNLDFGGQSKFLDPSKNMKLLADNWNEEIKKADVPALIHEMDRALELLQSPEVYTYVSKPIQPVKDIVIFDVKIKKHNQDKPDHNDNREFSYKEYTKGGMRFDAGVGFAISYFDDAAQYEIAPNDKGIDVITLKQKNLWVPSFVGIFTAGFRSNNLASFGISAGLGLSANEGKVQINNFYFGPSITLGRENRLCITGGITVKGVEELKSSLTEGTPVTNTNEISSFTNTAYKFGPFVSLTYNLTKGIRNNVKYLKK